MSQASLVLVGNPGAMHVGAHLHNAARSLGLAVRLCDATRAFGGPTWLRTLNWRLRGHRPTRLAGFSREVVRTCRELQPRWLLTTGLAPLDAPALEAIGRLGVRRLNYLTDDPWNPAHRAPWFLRGLPLYDAVCSPRSANLVDLRRLGCRQVAYVPFAYAPEVHYPESPGAALEVVASDVVFAGGADADRVPYLAALVRAGVSVSLYGGYWERIPTLRASARGHADPLTLRRSIAQASVALCLVRRANRDGHAMRSFEVPAMGGCMLVEDTTEHRALFGDDGAAVRYFGDVDELLDATRWLLTHPGERQRLAAAAHRLVVSGGHTYRDRLAGMLELEEAAA